MHGRLKVKSTAQQKAEKEEAQRKKLVAFQAAFSQVMTQRQEGSHDKDNLATIAGLLEKNPDVGVLWIYRREIFLSLRETLSNGELQSLFDSELDFLVTCLRVNPKSYFTWAHRCWILLNSPSPNWDRELSLCTRFLSLDERNFHCWDYRRWLVQQIGVCAEKELEFVTSKLYENFSNFSAWHYRSRLIPKAISNGSGACHSELPKNVMMEELDLVRNALFVDPTDQSPWFYYRWLLSNCTTRRVLPHSCLVTREPAELLVAFSRSVPLTTVLELKVVVKQEGREAQELSNLVWSPAGSQKASKLWTTALLSLDSPSNIVVQSGVERLICNFHFGDNYALGRTDVDPLNFFHSVTGSNLTSLIHNELDSIRELYSMESSSKWVTLGLCSLLRLTAPLDSEPEVCSLLEKLRISDVLRTSYYADFRSRVLSENQVIRCFQDSLSTFALKNCGLTAFNVTAWLPFFTDIDLSDNQLKTLPRECRQLVRLERFCLDSNSITSLAALDSLPSLQKLSVKNNLLKKMEDIAAVLNCPTLQLLNLHGNPVADIKFDSRWEDQPFEVKK